jgi:hypothetical protein
MRHITYALVVNNTTMLKHYSPHACRCQMLTSAPSGQEWYEAQFELPPELFKFDFVIMDKATGGVDNNRARVSCLNVYMPEQ